MNLDDKISRSIDEKLEEMAQLFNDVDDALDLSPVLRKLDETTPLWEDIKTEIKDIQNLLKRNPPVPQEEKKPKKEKDPNKYSPSDPEIQEMLKELPDLLRELDKFDNLPADPDGSSPPALPEVLEMVPGVHEVSTLYQLYKLWKIGREQHIRDKELWRKLTNGEITLKEWMQSRLEATKSDLQDIIDASSNTLIDDINEKFREMSGDMSDCCNNMSNKISQVLEAESPEMTHLAMGKLDKINSNLHQLRGLL